MITTSLKLSKRLKEAGFPEGEPNFYWVCTYKNVSHTEKEWKCIYDGHCNDAMTNNAGYGDPPLKYYVSSIEGGNEYSDDKDIIEKYPAYTAEEILEKLPNNLVIEVNSYDGLSKNYQVIAEKRRGVELPKGIICHAENNKNLADALACFYIYLKQHNLL